MHAPVHVGAQVGPFVVPALALGGLPMSGLDGDEVSSLGLYAVAGGWVALLGLAFLWRRRARARERGRALLSLALWGFAGLTTMLLVYKMLWGLEHGSGLLDEAGDVASRGFQALAFYIAAVVVGSREPGS